MSIVRVAKYAGVSTATVSRVLNAVPGVSEATANHVRSALKALAYDPAEIRSGPRPAHRRVLRHRKQMIALMTVGHPRDNLQLPVIRSVVDAIGKAARENGLRILLDEMPALTEMSSVILNREVDGAIVFLDDQSPLQVLGEMNRHVPVVWAMGGQAGPLPVDHVAENNTAIGHLAFQYLTDQGCEAVAYLTMEPQRRFAQQRGQGFFSAAAETGGHARGFVITRSPQTNALFGSETVSRPTLADLIDAFAESFARPTGLFIDRDATTSRAYPLLNQRGIRPGRDVKIISCDNEEVRLSSLDPRPASIDLGTEELGHHLISRMLLRLENKHEPPVLIQTTPRLILDEDHGSVQNNSISSASPIT